MLLQDALMGIGQKAFDARFANELRTLSEMGSTAGVVGSTYIHQRLGIAFDCPPGWTLRDDAELKEAMEARLISRDNDVLNKAIRAMAVQDLPIAVIAAPTIDDPIAHLGPHEITPLISLMHDDPIDPDEEATFDLLQHITASLFYSHALLQDYRLLERPKRTTLSGCDAVTYTAAYTAMIGNAVEGCPFREHAYFFTRGSDIYTLRMGDYPDWDPKVAFDYSEVVSSICLS